MFFVFLYHCSVTRSVIFQRYIFLKKFTGPWISQDQACYLNLQPSVSCRETRIRWRFIIREEYVRWKACRVSIWIFQRSCLVRRHLHAFKDFYLDTESQMSFDVPWSSVSFAFGISRLFCFAFIISHATFNLHGLLQLLPECTSFAVGVTGHRSSYCTAWEQTWIFSTLFGYCNKYG